MRFRFTTTCLLLVLVACNNDMATVIVSNRSGEDLYSVQVCLSSNKDWKNIDTLRTGSSTIVSFQNYTDAHYQVSCITRGGTIFSFETGYVTHSMSFRDSLTFIVDTLSAIQLSYVSSPRH